MKIPQNVELTEAVDDALCVVPNVWPKARMGKQKRSR